LLRRVQTSSKQPTDSGATRTKIRERKVYRHAVGYIFFANRILVKQHTAWVPTAAYQHELINKTCQKECRLSDL